MFKSLSVLVVTAIELKIKLRFNTAAMLLFYSLRTLPLHISCTFFEDVTIRHFGTQY
jgi:hypothetical protein